MKDDAAIKPLMKPLRNSLFLEVALFASIVVLLSLGTRWRNEVWNSQIALELDCIKKSPKKARSYTNLAYAYSNAAMYPQALETARRAVELDPKAAYAYFNMGIAFQNLGDLDKAIAMTRKALDLDPTLDQARLPLAAMYFEKNQYDEAAEEYRKFLSLYPYFPNVHHLLGIVYAAQHRLAQAVDEFEKELRVDPSHTLAHVNLGQLYWYEFRDRDKALYHLRKALMLDPFLPQRPQIIRLVETIAGAGG